jgi:hypothetical protein
MTPYSDLGYLAQAVWHGSELLYSSDMSNDMPFVAERAHSATALENRYDIARGTLTAYAAAGGTVNSECFSTLSAVTEALEAEHNGFRGTPNDVIGTSWHCGHGFVAGRSAIAVPRIQTNGNTFYGYLSTSPRSIRQRNPIGQPMPDLSPQRSSFGGLCGEP